VRDALAKGFPIDLHPRAFRTGFTAVTSAAHIGAQLWQIDDAPTYEIAVARGFALSFWHWLEASAAEYGIELVR
jgi:sarcosine oxidase subunit gamma